MLLFINLWGIAWALPFYIPAGVMALNLGGINHAALVTNIFDAVGFFSSALFSLPATQYGSKGHWTPVLLILTVANFIATASMYSAMKIDYNDRKKE